MRDRRFWILAAAFVAHGAATSTMTVHLVGYLASRGHPATFAATVAGLLGVLSVTGRLVLTGARRRLPRHHHRRRRLRHPGRRRARHAAARRHPRRRRHHASSAFGLGFGIASLATPALLADRYGTTAYATIAGRLAAPVTIAKAAAPLAAAALLHHGGYDLCWRVATACLIAAAGMLTVRGNTTRSDGRRSHLHSHME